MAAEKRKARVGARWRSGYGRRPNRPSSLPENMPLELNDAEMSLLTTLAAPIDQRSRPDFLRAVAAELEARQAAGAIGEGSIHRIARAVQRRAWLFPSGKRPRRRALVGQAVASAIAPLAWLSPACAAGGRSIWLSGRPTRRPAAAGRWLGPSRRPAYRHPSISPPAAATTAWLGLPPAHRADWPPACRAVL